MVLQWVPSLSKRLFCCYEIKWLENCSPEFKLVFYRRYVDDIFVSFNSEEHLENSILKLEHIREFSFTSENYFKFTKISVAFHCISYFSSRL